MQLREEDVANRSCLVHRRSSLVNELRAADWFNERYQVWLFGYSTGRPFVRLPADMRRECWTAFTALAGDTPDPALKRVVLIGHSMGDLLSKVQVTQSDAILWESFANRPLESLQTDQVTHQYPSDLFFFTPLPFVERVVFIGTPHGGSPVAIDWINRFTTHLVSRSHEFSNEYQNRARLTFRGRVCWFAFRWVEGRGAARSC